MSIKHDLEHSIIQITKNNKDGSYATQANRKERLLQVANQLVEGGYKIRHIKQLKLKHVNYLVKLWLNTIGPGTIKNRLSDLRWIAKKISKPDLIPTQNAALNIPRRQYVTNEDKSIALSEGDLSKITDKNVKMSLILQREFGLRRQESIKIKVNQAVVGDELRLKGSWCKNGRPRIIKIQYPEQRQALEQVKQYLKNSQRALIPSNKTFVQQLHIYEDQLKRAGIHKAHGLRHAYAQKCYFDLTGWHCSAKGGPLKSELTNEQKIIDKIAREAITLLLGHERRDVVAIYCGK